jgi:hypothetical protein
MDESVLRNTVRDDQETMTPVFSSMNHDAEMEALAIKGLLESNGIPALVVGPQVLPNLEFQVQVPEHVAEDALKLIAEARANGPEAAAEAEAAGESGADLG